MARIQTVAKPRTEFAMVRSVRRRLTAAGTISRMEVPLLGHSIDLVYLWGEHLCSVEFKLSNWRRALQQAIAHQLGADYAFICLPERSIPNEMETLLNEHGVGLLFFQPDGPTPWREMLPARASSRTWNPARVKVLTVLSVAAYEPAKDGNSRPSSRSLRHTG